MSYDLRRMGQPTSGASSSAGKGSTTLPYLTN